MPEIQIREKTKPANPLQKSNIIPKPLKNAYVRAQKHSEKLSDTDHESASEYASDNVQYMAEDIIYDAGSAASTLAKNVIQKGHDRTKAAKHKHQTGHQEGVPPALPSDPHEGGNHTRPVNNQTRSGVRSSRRPYSVGIYSERNTPKHGANPRRNASGFDNAIETPPGIKPRSNTISPSNRFFHTQATSEATIKPVKHRHINLKTSSATATTAKAAVERSYQATKAATQTAKNFAQRAASAAKATSNFLISSVKAAIAGTQTLVSIVAAGGGTALVIVVIICLVGLIVGSSFGIFFSSEDTGSTQTMQEVVQDINDAYIAKLDEIKATVSHDELEMAGARAVWPEVLAVYAVKITTDPDNPQEVASITDEKIDLLKDIFWQMNSISHNTDTISETVIIESDDGHGNIVEDEQSITNTYLYITVDHKTAEEMADMLHFNDDQMAQLEALLDDENNTLWTALLYGITSSDGQIVAVALSQVGNVGGEPYWSWYGFGSRVEWCACFVSWCANECGYIEAGVIPKFAACVNGVKWFQDRAQWLDNSAEPTPGMIIFFDWNKEDEGGQDGRSDHVGIVEKVENGRVYTVEGNSSNQCKQKSYPLGYYEILGYGFPAY